MVCVCKTKTIIYTSLQFLHRLLSTDSHPSYNHPNTTQPRKTQSQNFNQEILQYKTKAQPLKTSQTGTPGPWKCMGQEPASCNNTGTTTCLHPTTKRNTKPKGQTSKWTPTRPMTVEKAMRTTTKGNGNTTNGCKALKPIQAAATRNMKQSSPWGW